MVAVAVLTALAADLAYDARVSLQIAANARNELQATYLARSGVALGRLVLSFQQDIDAMQSPVAGMSFPRPQLWKLAPVGPELAAALMGGEPLERPEKGVASAPASGPAAGAFDVAIDDEGRKINFQLEALGDSSASLVAQVQAIWQLICDPKWDPLFDREDANGLRVSRTDLLVYLRDWVDTDAVSSTLAAAPAGCLIVVPPKPFDSGFGDENFPYDRGDDRYRAKNARMDSLDELYLVAGIGDAFMAAFRDHITVYLKRDEPQNVNTTDPFELRMIAQRMANKKDDPKLGDPAFLAALQKAVLEKTSLGILTMTPKDLTDIISALGVAVDPAALATNSPFTDKSTVFRLRSTARVGDVTKTLDVVMRVEKTQANQTTPGKVLHWREE